MRILNNLKLGKKVSSPVIYKLAETNEPYICIKCCSLKYSIRQPCESGSINSMCTLTPKKEALELSPIENLFLANTVKMLGEFISI